MQDRMTRRNLTERKEAHIEHLEAKLRDLEASIDSAAPWNESHNVKRESLRDELQEYRKGLGFDNLSRLERIPITNSLHQPPSAKTTLGHNVGIAGHLYQAAFDLFALITSKVKAVRSISKTEQRELLRVFQSLALWGEDHNLTSGELDSVLQDSTQLQKVTVATLRSVVKIVSQDLVSFTYSVESARLILQEHEVAQVLAQSRFVDRGNEEHSDSNSSDEDSSDSDQSESLNTKSLQMILPNLQRLLRCLHDLSTSIDSFSEVRDREQPSFANTTLADIQPYQYYANSIRERFPAAEAALVEAFGKANLLRHHHLQQLQAMYSESSAPMLILGVEDVISKQARSENMDSGYGTMRTASAYAPTITSSRGSSLVELGQSTYPPLPEQAKRGEPFDCVACGRRIIAKRKQEWRKHIREDLQPYSCVFASCRFGSTPLPDRKTWTEHLLLDHANEDLFQSFTCLICKEIKPDGKHAMISHLARHLEEISLSALTRDVESENPSESSKTESVVSSILFEDSDTDRKHPLYQVLAAADGFLHCPFSATENCGHIPATDKQVYDRYIDHHLQATKINNISGANTPRYVSNTPRYVSPTTSLADLATQDDLNAGRQEINEKSESVSTASALKPPSVFGNNKSRSNEEADSRHATPASDSPLKSKSWSRLWSESEHEEKHAADLEQQVPNTEAALYSTAAARTILEKYTERDSGSPPGSKSSPGYRFRAKSPPLPTPGLQGESTADMIGYEDDGQVPRGRSRSRAFVFVPRCVRCQEAGLECINGGKEYACEACGQAGLAGECTYPGIDLKAPEKGFQASTDVNVNNPASDSRSSSRKSLPNESTGNNSLKEAFPTIFAPPARRRSISAPAEDRRRASSTGRAAAPVSPTNKQHKCPYCSTTFTRHHNLKSHLLTHSQEKPYECQTCQSRFRRLHDLKRHTKLHTGERPHTCPKCGRRFARGDALARHITGPGGCAGLQSEATLGDPDGDNTDAINSRKSDRTIIDHRNIAALSSTIGPSVEESAAGQGESNSQSHDSDAVTKQSIGCSDCEARFASQADRDRHVLCVHIEDKKYPCMLEGCTRKGDGAFTRQDHLREHKRNYHKMDIPKKSRRAVEDVAYKEEAENDYTAPDSAAINEHKKLDASSAGKHQDTDDAVKPAQIRSPKPRNAVAERLQAAHLARVESSMDTSPFSTRSPFRPDSPYVSRAYNNSPEPRTISPKDALLDYQDSEEDAGVPLFPDSGIHHDQNLEDYSPRLTEQDIAPVDDDDNQYGRHSDASTYLHSGILHEARHEAAWLDPLSRHALNVRRQGNNATDRYLQGPMDELSPIQQSFGSLGSGRIYEQNLSGDPLLLKHWAPEALSERLFPESVTAAHKSNKHEIDSSSGDKITNSMKDDPTTSTGLKDITNATVFGQTTRDHAENFLPNKNAINIEDRHQKQARQTQLLNEDEDPSTPEQTVQKDSADNGYFPKFEAPPSYQASDQIESNNFRFDFPKFGSIPSTTQAEASKKLPPIEVDTSDIIAMKRARNTLAARESRSRKMEHTESLERRIQELEERERKYKETFGALPDEQEQLAETNLAFTETDNSQRPLAEATSLDRLRRLAPFSDDARTLSVDGYDSIGRDFDTTKGPEIYSSYNSRTAAKKRSACSGGMPEEVARRIPFARKCPHCALDGRSVWVNPEMSCPTCGAVGF